jgi:hypothetical protein
MKLKTIIQAAPLALATTLSTPAEARDYSISPDFILHCDGEIRRTSNDVNNQAITCIADRDQGQNIGITKKFREENCGNTLSVVVPQGVTYSMSECNTVPSTDRDQVNRGYTYRSVKFTPEKPTDAARSYNITVTDADKNVTITWIIPERHATLSEARDLGEGAGREAGKKAAEDALQQQPKPSAAEDKGGRNRLELTAGPRWGVINGQSIEGTPKGVIGNLGVHWPINESEKWSWGLGLRTSYYNEDVQAAYRSALDVVDRSTLHLQGAPSLSFYPANWFGLRGRLGLGFAFINEDGLAARQDAATGIVYGQEPLRHTTLSFSPEIGAYLRAWEAVTLGGAVGMDNLTAAPGQPGDRDDKRFIHPYIWLGGGIDTNL